ncbi:phosphoribosylformylglycinamidine cyclo-ligase [Agrilactobacillus fermenti]|uniref:phosphoribosylformylglycinamidine cyclo-ligase n=1 Tax=Agrilactobacillus fermenti TaxID=2586909 RepID=UPI001E4D2D9D|nr:phosphoribosylformylglycinamidine cyclo-ligase [Agrilactobacillus fermenti]MCD2255895.1 phosphoribosylformylglycinamidine cyclo-ligase [Agrilactobacillus fermenti]
MTQDAYTAAGVNIAAGDAAVAKIAQMTASTQDANVLAGVGGFGSLYALPRGYQEPVLVSGSDGVGTKLLVAIAANNCHTIGQDLVAMCVNDIVAQGAKPLFFLDYLGIHQVDPDQVAAIVQGIKKACELSDLSLIGGETAEMPDMYAPKHYDLAGFATGIVEKEQRLLPEHVVAGDILLGLPSSGLHSNGYSLVRQILFKDHNFKLTDDIPELGTDVTTALLTPTRIYARLLQPLLQQQLLTGVAHITGGGLVENLPRILPDQLAVQIDQDAWQVPKIFTWLQKLGHLSAKDMLQTFNLGIGIVLVVKPAQRAEVEAILQAQGETYYQLGQVVPRQEAAVIFTGSSQI